MWDILGKFIVANPIAAGMLFLSMGVGIPPLVLLVRALKGDKGNGHAVVVPATENLWALYVTKDELEAHLDGIREMMSGNRVVVEHLAESVRDHREEYLKSTTTANLRLDQILAGISELKRNGQTGL